MHTDLIDILRCPFCGTALSIVENDALSMDGAYMEVGVLGCECCAFPVVAGIPVLIADESSRRALDALEDGRREDALLGLLGLSGDTDRSMRFQELMSRDSATYREALELLCLDAEGTYFLYRFSDPSYVTTEALIRAIGQQKWPMQSRVLDLCGGSGHISRALTELTPDAVLADVYFWKLWLAQQFTAPKVAPVCCDANSPLPFVRDTFSTVLLADAFPYIWNKRLMAEEMMRLVGEDGVLVMSHLHSSLGDNFSAGDTLTPTTYRALFALLGPRLFSDQRMRDNAIGERVIDLTQDVSPEDLGHEPELTLIATGREELFQRYEVPAPDQVTGELMVNPLYKVELSSGASVLTLSFPTAEYEEEFAECLRYLPDTITVEADLTGPIRPEMLGSSYGELRERRVIIDAPIGYC
jgi:uncharacterized protein YbaR (Trm112 family)/SAM-dependent methyltransferase